MQITVKRSHPQKNFRIFDLIAGANFRDSDVVQPDVLIVSDLKEKVCYLNI